MDFNYTVDVPKEPMMNGFDNSSSFNSYDFGGNQLYGFDEFCGEIFFVSNNGIIL